MRIALLVMGVLSSSLAGADTVEPPAFAIGVGGSFRYGPRANLGVDLDGLIRIARETYVHVGGSVGGAHSNNLTSSEGADGSFFDIKAGLARLHCRPSACLSVANRGGH